MSLHIQQLKSTGADGDMKHVIHELTFGDSIKVCLFLESNK